MEGCQPNVVTYNTLVDLYGKIGRPADAVATLDTMQMHVSPFLGVTWAYQASACFTRKGSLWATCMSY